MFRFQMPKSLGGTAQIRTNVSLNITHLASQSDPSVPLVSIFSPAIWHPESSQQQQQLEPAPLPLPRPRPSLQVYYTAPDAADPARLTSAARALEAKVLAERHEGRDPAECDRLDVYGMPFSDSGGAGGVVVNACVEHQRREIASRNGDKDWYIQRYDVGGISALVAEGAGDCEKGARRVGRGAGSETRSWPECGVF